MSEEKAKPDDPAVPPATAPALAPAPTAPPAPGAPPIVATTTIPASFSTLVPALAALPPEQEIKRVPLGRLSAVEIRNYRAFRGTFRLELPKGENLLIFGENGAGKSSLFHTLRTFFEAPELRVIEKNAQGLNVSRPIKISDDQHRFTSAEPGIKLEFGERFFEWTNTKNDTGHEIIRLLNQAKGFLDYKALLEVHYLRVDEAQEIDLFPLLMRSLLPYYTYTRVGGTSRKYLKGLDLLRADAKKSWSPEWRRKLKREELQISLDAYNEALEKTVHDLGERASVMLRTFGDDFGVTFKYDKAAYRTWPKRVEAPKILAMPAFRKLQFPDYHSILNEARLSALAICLFFAALKESPATGLRLLVLDDILIGLDMANRVKVVDLIRDHFHDWQIIVLTYSKAWFERLKDHLNTPNWKSVVFWEEWRDEEKSPRIVVEDNGNLIEMARSHLKHKDFTAAAIYSRKALEFLCNRICSKANLPVLHVETPKGRKVEHFLNALEPRLAEIADDQRRARALLLIGRLKQAREFVLNRNAHFDVEEEDALSGEVGAAIDAVNDLAMFLDEQRWENDFFHSGRPMIPVEQMKAHLTAARELAAKPAPRQCQSALGEAFGWFWREYGKKLGVMLPLGIKPTSATIWKAAIEQNKIPGDVVAKLDAHKPYLYGSVKVTTFDPSKFEEAAKLLEDLITPAAAAASPNIACLKENNPSAVGK